jgi:HEAT repeat protein
MNNSQSLKFELEQLFKDLDVCLSEITHSVRNYVGEGYAVIVHHILNLIPQSSNPKICTLLIGQLQSASHEITRSTAAQALGKLKDVNAIESLLQALGNPNEYEEVRSEAALALGQIGSIVATSPLIENLRNKRNGRMVMWHCADALGCFSDPSVVDALTDALTDDYSGIKDSSDIRDAASNALGVIGSDYVVTRLLELLDRESLNPKDYMDKAIRHDIIMTLGKSKNFLCIAPLLKILNDALAENEYHSTTVVALSNFTDPRIVPALEIALSSADEMTRIQAKLSLEKIEGK